jgi:hypothetical protein
MSKVNALVLLQKYCLYLGLGRKQFQYRLADNKTYWSMYIKVKVKVKFTPEQATKAQRGSRDTALLFL